MGRLSRGAAVAAGSVVSTVALALGVALAPPAAAHPPSITFDPALLDRYLAPPTFAGHATHDGAADADMRQVEVTYRSALAHGPGGCAVPAGVAFSGQGTRTDFGHQPQFECNGRYEVQVRAVSGSNALHPEDTAEAGGFFDLALPPAVVTGLEAVPSSGVVALSWNANTEKDLYGYLVDRRTPDGPFEAVALVHETRYLDQPPADGAYTYRVWAVRLGPEQDPANEGDLVLASAPSTSASATHTTPHSGGGGDGGGGGSGDGGSGGGDGDGGTTPATTATPPPRPDLSGFQRLKAQVEADQRARTTTTADVFEETLPFEGGARPPSDGLGDGDQQAGPRERSTFEEVVDRRAALVPVAAGLVLFMGALQLRYLTRRAARQAAEG